MHVARVAQRREVAKDEIGRTMSLFTQTQQEPTKKQMEWFPSAVMDMQIYSLCRTLHFLVVKVGDPVFAHAIRDDSSVSFRLRELNAAEIGWCVGHDFVHRGVMCAALCAAANSVPIGTGVRQSDRAAVSRSNSLRR